ncbi:MAG: glycosyltransferase family 4 protein [Acidobacteriia bacterium]|nr:glycosyltransferase family 4 protein [Terriglobia bacterium]
MTKMEWHIVTGEFPPALGGVSDYTQQLVAALVDVSEQVHVWAPACSTEPQTNAVRNFHFHPLPSPFQCRWLRALDQGLAGRDKEAVVLVQYVPHMYGWKAMNLGFCWWLFKQRRRNLLVMFHEVAFPFKPGQPWKHHLLAAVHRLMAWMMLRSARHSFTSIESYEELLRSLAPEARIRLLRLFSNVPFDTSSSSDGDAEQHERNGDTLGVFSSFNAEICELLEHTLPTVLENPAVHVLLIGPGAALIERFCATFPKFRDRLSTSGHVNALEVGRHFRACDVLLQLYPDGAAGARGTLLAALASGVPVVTTAGRLTDPLLKSSNAIVFADPYPSAIRRAIDDLLANKARARMLGASTRRFYETHYDVAVAVKTLKEAARESAAVCDLPDPRPVSRESLAPGRSRVG